MEEGTTEVEDTDQDIAERLTKEGLSRFVAAVLLARRRARRKRARQDVAWSRRAVLVVLLAIGAAVAWSSWHVTSVDDHRQYESSEERWADNRTRSMDLKVDERKRSVKRLARRVCGTRRLLVLNMFPNARSGWGFLSMNIFVRLANEGKFCPILTDTPEGEAFHTHYNLKSSFLNHYYNQQAISEAIRPFVDDLSFLNCTVFHAIPGTFDAEPGYWGIRNIGYLTIEQASIRDDELVRAKQYDFIISPSRWNTRILRRHNIDNVATVLQGIDLDLFDADEGSEEDRAMIRTYYERLRSSWRDDQFVIFSGGKMEFRKGQDIVVEAFRRFSETHDDASLVTLWYNRHKNMEPVVKEDFGISKTDPQSIVNYLVSKGVRRDRVDALGYVDQHVIIATLMRSDVAVFTNRAEGATNLLAMEAMAAETPTIVSNNTGHQDITGIADDGSPHCFALNRQSHVHRRIMTYNGHLHDDLLEDWGESSVEEVLEKLEYVYRHRERAKRVGQRGARFVRRRTWAWSVSELSRVLWEETTPLDRGKLLNN